MLNNKIVFILLAIISIKCCYAFTFEKAKLELLNNKFRLSIPNDSDIKWVAFNVNINKEFKNFEIGELVGIVNMPRNMKWSYVFDKKLESTDVVYVWIAIQHNRLIFRDKQGPFQVSDFMRKKNTENRRMRKKM